MRIKHFWIYIAIYLFGVVILGASGFSSLRNSINLRNVYDYPFPIADYYSPPYLFLLLAMWIIIRLYALLYDYISDFWQKVFEGLIAGGAISSFMFLTNIYFKGYVWTEVGDFYESDLVPIPHIQIPIEFFYFIGLFLIGWASIDIYKRRPENIIPKVGLLVSGYFLLIIIPARVEWKYVIIPVIVIMLSIGYYLWLRLPSRRLQIAIPAYTVVFIGLIVTIARHWAFFTGDSLLGNYNKLEAAEVVNDIIVLFLGFFITSLELVSKPKVDYLDRETKQAQDLPVANEGKAQATPGAKPRNGFLG